MAKKTTPKPRTSSRKKAAAKAQEAEATDTNVETAQAETDTSEAPFAKVEDAEVIDTTDTSTPDTDTDTEAHDAVEEQSLGENDTADETAASETEPEPERKSGPTPSASSSSQANGTSPIPLIAGGLIAGFIGFVAAYFTGVVNQAEQAAPVDLTQIEASISAQNDRIDTLAGRIPEPQAASDTAALEAKLSELSNNVAELRTSLSELNARIDDLENAPPAASGAPASDPALFDDVAELQAALAAQEAEITAMQAEADAAKDAARNAAADTLKRAAMTRVHTALETGAPYGDALTELQQLGIDTPATLNSFATSGVVTLASLLDGFPDAARAALSADRAQAAEDGNTSGFGDFLRDQLGARSLTPQEGDSTDAVLSRVEAALRDGRMTDALAELQTLPDVAKPAMSQWQSLAQQRADALAAAQDLSDSLN